MSGLPIGQFLVESGRIDAQQLQQALLHQQRSGGRLGQALVALRLMREADFYAELGRRDGVPFVQVNERQIPPQAVQLLPARLIRTRRVFPLGVGPGVGRRGTVYLATAAPQDLLVLDEVAFASGMTVTPVLVSDRELDALIERHLGPASRPANAA